MEIVSLDEITPGDIVMLPTSGNEWLICMVNIVDLNEGTIVPCGRVTDISIEDTDEVLRLRDAKAMTTFSRFLDPVNGFDLSVSVLLPNQQITLQHPRENHAFIGIKLQEGAQS
jgi:hypothetical protein